MQTLDFPVELANDIHITQKTADGHYVINYRRLTGESAFIWLAEDFEPEAHSDPEVQRVLDEVKHFLAG